LARWSWRGTDQSVGPSEIVSLVVMEIDGSGNLATLVVVDPDDYGIAYAELDRCYATEVASKNVTDSWNRVLTSSATLSNRDWNAQAAQLSADLVVYDHRLLGWETFNG